MLEKLLLIPFQLMSNQPNLPPPEYYIHQYLSQKPAIVYVQASKDLSHKLLREADRLSESDPNSAIQLYRLVIEEGGDLKEDAIKKIGNIYEAMVYTQRKLGDVQSFVRRKQILNNALNFYNEVTEIHSDSPYLAEAYLNSGKILCCEIEPRNMAEGIKRLIKASDIAPNVEIKVKAFDTLGNIEWSNAGAKKRGFSLENAEYYFLEIIKLLPGSDIASIYEWKLKQIEFQKTK